MIKRQKYLQQLIDNRNNGFPKIITGIRRCGKSYLVSEIFTKYLIENGFNKENILIIELDDDRYVKYRDPLLLGQYVRNYCQNKKDCVVFLDEIQMVYTIVNPNLTNGEHKIATKKDTQVITFVDVVLGLSREKNIDLFVSGSNSKMLSSDIVTQFRDKSVNIHISPLSFDEYYNHKKGSKIEALYEFLQYGGMPLAVLKKDDDKKKYLSDLFETTYFKDIVDRNNLRRSSSLDELCNILSECTGSLINSKKISDTFKSVTGQNIDSKTVDAYINYFVDAFLLREARRYDVKGRSEIGALRKYYFVDTGLRNARLNFAFSDEGALLENVVYNELVYHGYSVNVGTFVSIEKDKNGNSVRKTNEIDFYAQKGNKNFYIQVCSDLNNTKTKTRELRPYFMLNDSIQKILVVNRPIDECLDENNFTIIGAADFLLRLIKE